MVYAAFQFRKGILKAGCISENERDVTAWTVGKGPEIPEGVVKGKPTGVVVFNHEGGLSNPAVQELFDRLLGNVPLYRKIGEKWTEKPGGAN